MKSKTDGRRVDDATHQAPGRPMDPPEILPIRLQHDGRTATWNPAVTRAGYVLVHVRGSDGGVEVRRTVNSGRARVREGERIEKVTAGVA